MKRLHVRHQIILLLMSINTGVYSLTVSPLYTANIAVTPLMYNGKVCVQDFMQGSYKIDLVTVTSGASEELRNNTMVYLYPLTFGGTHAAWIGYGKSGGGGGGNTGSGGSYYIQAINTSDKAETKVVQDIYYIERLAASENRIVWTDYRYFSPGDTTIEIFLYDFSSASETRITSRQGYKSAPFICDDMIAWQDYRNASADPKNADIFLYDLGSGQEKAICTNPSYQDQPSVYNNRIVWQDYRNTGSDSKNADIYLYDLNTGTEQALCTAPGWQGYPHIYGNIVVWQDYRNATQQDSANADIYLFDLSTGEETAVTTKAGYQGEPDVDGTYIVWFDYTDNTVYKAALGTAGVETSARFSITPKTAAPQKVMLTASGMQKRGLASCDVRGRTIACESRHMSSGAYVKRQFVFADKRR